MPTDSAPLEILDGLLERASKAGADTADAVLFQSAALSVAQRLGATEKIERSESSDLGLRVFIGKKQAIVSSTDFAAETLSDLVERAVATARLAPEDPHCGIADPGQIATEVPEIDIFEAYEPSAEGLTEMAARAEDAARAVPGVTNSEGAEAGWSRSIIALAATNGFARTYETTSHSISAAVLAGEGTAMERDYDWSTAVYHGDLKTAAEIGHEAGERAVKRVGARKMKTQQVPVVYGPRVSGGLLRHLSGAINGQAIARGTSFLKDSLGKAVFDSNITIVDDPHRKRGLRSKPFDAEGIANTRRNVIDGGRLTTWILDLGSARKLSLETTGNAARGVASPPGPSVTNFYLEPGTATPEEMIADIDEGFYITELIGFGVNNVTGDYSRGAAGYWIESGGITYPVSEVTIAGNLKDMFGHMVAANDLEFRTGTDAPTVRIDGMTVAGT